MLLVAGLVHLIMLEGFQKGTASEYSEHSLTEWLESGCALLSALLFFVVARLNSHLRPTAAMLAALCLMMFIREADFYLDNYVFEHAWKILVAGVLAAISLYLWRHRHAFADSLATYVNQASAGIFLGGFLVLLVFSRLFGRERFWEAVMGDGYMRVVKNIAEEGTEIMGYGLMMIAAGELLVNVLANNRDSRSNTKRTQESSE